MTKKDNKEVGKQERLKEASSSSVWSEVIKPELEAQLDIISDMLITLQIETDPARNYTAGEIFIGRRLACAYLKDVINQVEVAGILQDKSDEDKAKDSFE